MRRVIFYGFRNAVISPKSAQTETTRFHSLELEDNPLSGNSVTFESKLNTRKYVIANLLGSIIITISVDKKRIDE